MKLMPNSFNLSPLAESDLEDIWLYTFKTWSIAQADSYISNVIQACNDLATGDKKGQSIESMREGYFKYAIGSHFIFYRYKASKLEIIRILHQRMDVERYL